ncbi:MAG: phosphoribosylformylglycinamidine cyclo-ligase [Chloroflexi bacterium]|nr:MAG: phosphoribosylformylglycinamidine cyclo-ligase [Chloroflexota bacterium]
MTVPPQRPPDPPRRSISYADAGVDIDAGDATARRFGAIGRGTHGPEVLRLGGGFAGLFALGDKGYRDPVLVGATDGVGTKVLIAAALDQFEGVGRDVVNNNVNDLITVGAEPLFFLDYLATADLPQERRIELVEGIGSACREQGIALLGGETADMPDVYRSGDYDLAGFIVGVVERDAIIDGSRLAEGDALVALPSTGLQTNGYSLAREIWGLGKGMRDESPAARDTRLGTERAILEERPEELGGVTLGEALLAVHSSFYPALKPLRGILHAAAHITGGGIPGNLGRPFPETLAAQIDRSTWKIPPLFTLIQREGNVTDAEMFRTFNMGAGMIIAVAASDLDATLAALPGAWRIGEVVARGNGGPVRGVPGT